MLPGAQTKKQLDVIGGIGSILTGFFCAFIGWADLNEGRAWHIWAFMTLVLVVNGLVMFRYAAKNRPGSPLSKTTAGQVAKQHT